VNSTELAGFAAQMTDALKKRPELADVDNNLVVQGNALQLTVDREKASRLGVPMQTIDDTLYDAFGQRQISTIFTQLNQYRVVLEVAPEFRTTTALLDQLTVRGNGNGALTGSNATTYGQVTSSNSATVGHRQYRQRRHRGRRRRRDSLGVGDGDAGQRAARGQPPGSAAGGDDLVQPRARLLAVGRGDRVPRRRIAAQVPAAGARPVHRQGR
jgi:hypothetical protein